jgi:putative redox protein
MREVTVTTDGGKFRQAVRVGSHLVTSDEPPSNGGDDAGPAPHELLLAALGSCTSMTVKMYADRKGWPLRSVEVRVSAARASDGFDIRRELRFDGELDAEQRERLLEIANKCPVHKTLSGTIRIASSLV